MMYSLDKLVQMGFLVIFAVILIWTITLFSSLPSTVGTIPYSYSPLQTSVPEQVVANNVASVYLILTSLIRLFAVFLIVFSVSILWKVLEKTLETKHK